MKFSIVIPVYNVEKYIEKCLNSIYSQSYNNYEVIIVNDGSKDNSDVVIKKFIKEKQNFSLYKKENGGLSDARNFGVTKSSGDYIVFLDGDDYIEPDLLLNLNEVIKKGKFDVVRYELKLVDENNNVIAKPKTLDITTNKKDRIIKTILNGEYIEPAWLYVYNAKFWKKNKFEYPKGRIHEDYGLTPIVLNKAKSIGYTNYVGYNYVQRENSIMSQVDYDKIKKRVNDFKEQFLHHRQAIKGKDKCSKLLLSFSAEALIYKARELKDDDRKKFIKFIKAEKVLKQVYPYNLKKLLIKIYLCLFLEKRIDKLSDEFYSNK